MPARPAFQREASSTNETITSRVHQLHGLKQMSQKKKYPPGHLCCRHVNVDISCKYGYFTTLALTVMLFPLPLKSD